MTTKKEKDFIYEYEKICKKYGMQIEWGDICNRFYVEKYCEDYIDYHINQLRKS